MNTSTMLDQNFFERERRRYLGHFPHRKFDVFGEGAIFSGTGPVVLSEDLHERVSDTLLALFYAFEIFLDRQLEELPIEIGLPPLVVGDLKKMNFMKSFAIAKPDYVLKKGQESNPVLLDFNISNGLSGYDQLAMMFRHENSALEAPLFFLQLAELLSTIKREILILDLSYAETYRGKLLVSFLKASGIKARYARLGIDNLDSIEEGSVCYRNFHISRLFENEDTIDRLLNLSDHKSLTFWTNPLRELVSNNRFVFKLFRDSLRENSDLQNSIATTMVIDELSVEDLIGRKSNLILRSQNPSSLRGPPRLLKNLDDQEIVRLYESDSVRSSYIVQELVEQESQMHQRFTESSLIFENAPATYSVYMTERNLAETIVQLGLLSHRLRQSSLILNLVNKKMSGSNETQSSLCL